MFRWEPDTRERLERAALELFVEHGFDAVTVPEITARAGLTTRTFFGTSPTSARCFSQTRIRCRSCRPVWCSMPRRILGRWMLCPKGYRRWRRHSMAGLSNCSNERPSSMATTGCANANCARLERLVDAIAEAFRNRGVDDLTAAVVAETAVGVVKVALRRWIESDGRNRCAPS